MLCLPSNAKPPEQPDDSPGGPASGPEGPLIPADDDTSAELDDDAEPDAETADVDACTELARSDSGLGTGTALIDLYFAEVEQLTARAAALEQRRIATFAQLAALVGADDVTAQSIVDAYPAWLVANVGVEIPVLMWAPSCPLSVAKVDELARLCDPELGPTATLECTGKCVGFAEASCGGQLECWTERDAECGGFCEGECDVTLNVEGVCDGACTGTCRSPSDTCGAGTSVCVTPDAAVPCTESCEGELDAPPALDGCGETALAGARLIAECTATPPVPFLDGTPDAGVVTNPEAVSEFFTGIAEVIALAQEADLVLGACAELAAAADAVGNAAATTEGEADAGAGSGCPALLLAATPGKVGQAGSDLSQLLSETSTLVSGLD